LTATFKAVLIIHIYFKVQAHPSDVMYGLISGPMKKAILACGYTKKSTECFSPLALDSQYSGLVQFFT
jgi:hypothetical protein